MKFHAPSFIAGLATGLALQGARERLRPLLVEMGTVGASLSKLGLALFERQREWLEDLWAEVDERVADKFRGERSADGEARSDGARTAHS